MRLWSIHPRYLDSKGIGALWREALLAQNVLRNQTRGWRNHPQLDRFRGHITPVPAIGFYLLKIHDEAVQRGYRYDRSKIERPVEEVEPIEITTGQLTYELAILMERLESRAPVKHAELLPLRDARGHPEAHPLFTVIEGDVGTWETSYWRARRDARLGEK